MNRADCIGCIQVGRYIEAANFITKVILKEKTQTLKQKEREKITKRVADVIRNKHTKLKRVDIGLKPKEIAEQVYDETLLELMPPESMSSGNLSDELEGD